MRSVARTLLLLLAWLALGTAAHASAKVALLIGNSAYSGAAAAALGNPVRDVEALRQTLTSAGFDVVIVENATRPAMSAALNEFQEKATGAEVGLVYYSGHGIEMNGSNFLLPVDVKLASDRDVKYEAIALDDVIGALDGVKKLKLVLLDACRDNPFLNGMKQPGTRGARSRGLARIDTADGNLLVGYATAPGAVALDGDGENSPYAGALVRHLVEPGVEIETALRAVAKDVYDHTKGQQRPFKTGSLLDTIVLNPAPETQAAPAAATTATIPAAPAASPALPDPCRDASAHWDAIKDRHDKDLLAEHLRLFGTCSFASIAKLELASIQTTQAAKPEVAAPKVEEAPAAPADPLVSEIQAQLQRTACLAANPTGTWDMASADAADNFLTRRKVLLDDKGPSTILLQTLKAAPTDFCKRACPSGLALQDGKCVSAKQLVPTQDLSASTSESGTSAGSVTIRSKRGHGAKPQFIGGKPKGESEGVGCFDPKLCGK